MSIGYIVVSNIIIDDIVLPDGTTHMNTLGGAGTHAAMGMRTWDANVGFVSTAGRDLPDVHRGMLGSSGVDLAGVKVSEKPTPRAWQLLEPDGQRTEVFRTPFEDLQAMIPRPDDFPSSYYGAKGAYILSDAPEVLLPWVERLRNENVRLILWEPCSLMDPDKRSDFANMLAEVDIVSPDLDGAAGLYGLDSPTEIVTSLLDDGARVVALRMGARGSLVGTSDGQRYEVPVCHTEVVDVTGAGNAYCGGFLVGYAETGDAWTAGLYAAVSASFALEQFGPHEWTPELTSLATQRLARLQSTA